MVATGIFTEIVQVESADEQGIFATIYLLGTNKNESFTAKYSELTTDQKTAVDNFRALIIELGNKPKEK
jgi:hypothetical protein